MLLLKIFLISPGFAFVVISQSSGSSLKGATTEVRRITTADDLFLAVALRYRHETLEPIVRSLREIRIIHHNDYERTARLQWMMGRLADKPARWSELSDAIAHAADLGITRVELEERDVPPEALVKVRRLRDRKSVV